MLYNVNIVYWTLGIGKINERLAKETTKDIFHFSQCCHNYVETHFGIIKHIGYQTNNLFSICKQFTHTSYQYYDINLVLWNSLVIENIYFSSVWKDIVNSKKYIYNLFSWGKVQYIVHLILTCFSNPTPFSAAYRLKWKTMIVSNLHDRWYLRI